MAYQEYFQSCKTNETKKTQLQNIKEEQMSVQGNLGRKNNNILHVSNIHIINLCSL
jgi:hypothetical protein